MKKGIIIVLAALLTGSAAFAQEDEDDDEFSTGITNDAYTGNKYNDSKRNNRRPLTR